jgi:NADPH2:quinone reductase
VPAATAWRALFIRGGAKKAEKVLIHGGSGSVGQAAIQLGRGRGLECFATAGTDRGCELIEKLGAQSFNHNNKDYLEQLLKATGGRGFDVILEMLANTNLENDLNMLAKGGRVVIIGSRGRIEIDPRATMGKETDIRGLALFNSSEEELVATHQGLAEAIAGGFLSPTISLELPLTDAAKAHRMVIGNGNCGKIVLIP